MKALVIAALLIVGFAEGAAAQPRPAAAPKPEGEMRWALYVTLAPAWFDPGEITGGLPHAVLGAL